MMFINRKHTEETKKKMREARKKQIPPMKGRCHSEEAKKKMSEKNSHYWKGKKFSEETKLKMSKAQIGKKQSKETCENRSRALKGSKRTEETKMRISISNKGKIPWNKGRKHSEKTKEKIRNAHVGMKPSEETKLKMSLAHNSETVQQRHRDIRLSFTLPIKDTSIEIKVKKQLEDNHIKFIHPWNLGDWYQCDFFLSDFNLILECDGDYWHSLSKRQLKDKQKDTYARNLGYSIMRLPEFVINNEKFDIKFALNGMGTAICL